MNSLAVRSLYDHLILRYAIACTTIMIAVFAASRLVWGDVDAIDRTILIALRDQAAQPGVFWTGMKQLMLFLTFIGSFTVLAVLTLIVAGMLVWARRGRVAARLVIAAGSGMAAANLLKLVVGRVRPEVVPHWIGVSSLSFPSGHTSDSTIAYLLMAMLAIDLAKRVAVQRAIAASIVVPIALIGASRVYLGVHWPTDVLAGWAFGSMWVFTVEPFLRHPDSYYGLFIQRNDR